MTTIPTLAAATALAILAFAPPATAQQPRDPFPPKYDDLMHALCRSPASEGACVMGDKKLSYWISFDTVVDGRKWYTAIAIARPHRGSADLLGPDAKMPISQVTYELKNGAWTLIARQIGFGAVYVNNTGNPAMDDDDGQYFSQIFADGVLVGYPTVTMAGEGVNLHAHTMFRSAPDRSGRWLYGGDIVDASDNDAGCDRDNAPETCYRSSAKLSITGKVVAGWPQVRTTQAGTLPGPGGKARRAGPADGLVWHFDTAHGAYYTDEAH